jgi:hypothetical protein
VEVLQAVDEACGSAAPGPEQTFAWTPGLDTQIALVSDSGDTRFYIFEDGAYPCLPGTCIAGGQGPVTFAAQADTTYFIVVDTIGDGQTAAQVEMVCALAQEQCDNGLDDDDDGLTDCDDTVDCKLYGDCPSLEVCDDGVDNDGDGQSDCKDLGCIGYDGCVDQEACTDGVDNDQDGATDCDDSLCVVDPACQ